MRTSARCTVTALVLLCLSIPLFASLENDAESILFSLIPTLLTYADEGAAEVTGTILSLDERRVEWSDRTLVSSDILFAFKGEQRTERLLFFLEKDESLLERFEMEVKELLPEVAYQFFKLENRPALLRYEEKAPLSMSGLEIEEYAPGDFMRFTTPDGAVHAIFRLDSVSEKEKFLAAEWSDRELVDYMPLSTYGPKHVTASITLSSKSISFSPMYAWYIFPSSYFSVQTGLSGNYTFGTGSVSLAPFIGLKGELLLSRVLPSIDADSWLNRIKGTCLAEIGIVLSLSNTLSLSAYSSVTGGVSYRLNPSLELGLGITSRFNSEFSGANPVSEFPGVSLMGGFWL